MANDVIFRLRTQVVDKDDPRELAANIEAADKSTKEAQASVDQFGRKVEAAARALKEEGAAAKKAASDNKELGKATGEASAKAASLTDTVKKAGAAFVPLSQVGKGAGASLDPLIAKTTKLGAEATRTASAFERMKLSSTPGALPANATFRPSIAPSPAIFPGSGPGVRIAPVAQPRTPSVPPPVPEATIGTIARLRAEIDSLNKRKLTFTDPRQIQDANVKLQTLNNEVSRLDKLGTSAGRSTGILGQGLKSMISQAAGFLGIGAAVAGFFSVIRNGLTDLVQFDSALAELSSITGATGEDLDFLSEQAKEVGRTSTKSATDALRAFTAIGSARPDLLKNKEALAAVTKEAVALSEAANIDLRDSGAAVAAVMNQFGLGAGEASRIVNVLAAGSKEGAAEVADMTDTINKAGTVLAANNVTFEQGAALIETLAEKEIKGSVAGTQLRGVILKLVQSGKGFVDGQFNINAALEQTKKEFDAIQDPVKKAEKSIKLFGLENVTAGNILLENIPKFQQLTDAVTGTETAYEQQAKNNATISASFTYLKNAVTDVFLTVSSSTGTFAKAIRYLAENLRPILTVFGTFVATFAAYRGIVALTTLVINSYRAAKLLATTAQAAFGAATTASTTAVRGFGLALKSTGIGLLVSGLAAAIAYFVTLNDEVEEATEKQKAFNEELARTKRIAEANRSIDARVQVIGSLDEDQANQLAGDIDNQLSELKRVHTEALAAENIFSKELEDNQKYRNETAKRLRDQASKEEDASRRFDQALMADYMESRDKERIDTLLTTERRISSVEAEENIKRLEAYKKSVTDRIAQLEKLKKASTTGTGDGPIEGTIKALQEAQKKLLERLTDKLRIGSPEFFKVRDEYLKVTEQLKAARDLLGEQETFPAGSLNDLNQELSFLKQQLASLPEDSKEFNFIRDAVVALEKDVERLQEKMKGGKGADNTKALLAQLEEEKRHTLAIAELDEKSALARAKKRKASEDELTRIEHESQQERLKLSLEFERRKLAILEASGTATEEELKNLRNVIHEMWLELQMPEVNTDDGVKDLVERVTTAADQIAQAGIQAWRSWSDAQERSLDLQLQQQAARVEEARGLAEKGNAKVLEEEKNRLQELTNARKKAAQQTAAIAQVEAAANAAVAISRAAAEGGGFLSAITIASTLIALTAGLAQARTLATASIPQFYHGGEYGGGYTGEGNPRSVSTAVGPKPYIYHRREYIMPHEVVGVGRNREWLGLIHRGRLNMDQLFSPRITVKGGGDASSRQDADRIVGAIERIPSTNVNVDADGVAVMVRGKTDRSRILNTRL